MKQNKWKWVFDKGDKGFWKVYEDKDKEREPLSIHHKHPDQMSRRELMAAGLIESAVFVAAPTIANLFLSRTAHAESAPDSNTLALFIYDSGGSDGHTAIAPDGVSTDGLAARGVHGNPNTQGDNRLGPTFMTNSAFHAAFLNSNPALATTMLGANRWAWIGNEARQAAILSKVRCIVQNQTTNDDGACATNPLSSVAAANKLLAGGDLYINTGLSLGGNPTNGHNTLDVAMTSAASALLRVTGNNSVRDALGNPGSSLFSDGSAADTAAAMAKLSEMQGGWSKRLAPHYRKNEKTIREASSIVTDYRQILPPQVLIPLDRMGATGVNLGNAFAAMVHPKKLARRICSWNRNNQDFHNGAAYLNAAQQSMSELANGLVALCLLGDHLGMEVFVSWVSGGGQRGGDDSGPNGMRANNTSDAGQYAVQACFTCGGMTPSYHTLGGVDPNNGVAKDDIKGSSLESPAVWGLANYAAFVLKDPAKAEDFLKKTLKNHAAYDFKQLIAFKG